MKTTFEPHDVQVLSEQQPAAVALSCDICFILLVSIL